MTISSFYNIKDHLPQSVIKINKKALRINEIKKALKLIKNVINSNQKKMKNQN